MSAGRLSLRTFVEVTAITAANPARLYGLYPCKGALMPGDSDADSIIWYPDRGMESSLVLENKMLHHNVDYSPYEGRTFRQWPRYTVLPGEVVWGREHGDVTGKKGFGKFLERGESCLAGSRSPEEWSVENF